MLSLAGGKSVARPAYVVALGLGVLLVVLTAALFKTGLLELPESNTWSWATAGAAGGGGGGVSQQSATSSGDVAVAAAVAAAVQSRLDESLKQSEARMEAKLLKDLQLRSGGGPGGGATGSGYYDTYPNSDIDKLLAKYPAGSREQRELQARRYCSSAAAEDPAAGSGTSEENIVWVPTPGKHVLLVCEYGQMSNKLNCLRNTMLLAALLNRTLVVPELEGPPRHYNYTLMVDAPHARQCIAGNASAPPPTVVTLGEYMAGLTTSETPARLPRPAAARVDSVWCWRDACALDGYARMLPGVTFPATVSAAAVRRKVAAATDLRVLFGDLPDGVIAFGNTFNMRRIGGVPPAAWTAPNLPLFSQGGHGNSSSSRCRLLVQPHPALVVAAKGLVKTVLGRRYMAVHLRRGDFHNYWAPYCVRDAGANRARNTSFATAGCKLLDMAAIADCILEKLQGTGLSVVYVASNAAPPEAELLDGLLRANPRGGPPVTVVRAPLPLSAGSSSKDNNKFLWAKDWRNMGLDANPQARAVLDKLVCAMAHTFMGSPSSTFTDDIVAMRAGLGTLTCHDQDVCAVYALEPSDLLPDFNITYTDNYQGTRHYRRRLRRRRLR